MGGGSGASFMDPEFNEFLFAPIGEQENGMTVSVFSALARLGLDPWREAKRLSDLPMDGAIGALGDAIARVADLQWTKIDTARIAARLVQLLPSHLVERREAVPQRTAVREGGIALPGGFKLPALPIGVWLLIGGLIMGVMYFMSWNADTSLRDEPASPKSYDSAPQREQGKR